MENILFGELRLNARSENMGDDIRAAATDILTHTDAGVFHLGANRFTAQLLNDLNDLVHASGSNRVTAGFQPAAGGDGDLAGRKDFSIQREPGTLTPFSESIRLQGKGGHDRERIVKFKEIDLLWRQTGLLIGSL